MLLATQECIDESGECEQMGQPYLPQRFIRILQDCTNTRVNPTNSLLKHSVFQRKPVIIKSQTDSLFEIRMDPLDNDDLSRSVTELGEPESLFQISRIRFLTKLTVGVLFILAGLVANYFWWVEGPGRFDHYLLWLLMSLPITGSCLLWHMYRQRGLSILIYPTGLLRLRRGEIDSFPWSEIEQVRLKVQRADTAEIIRNSDGALVACWLTAEVPTFRIWKGGLHVTREDGIEAQFSAALTDYTQLADEVQRRTFEIRWPQVWERFLSGAPIAFGDLEFSMRGIHYGSKHIRWSEVKELTIMQGILRIKQKGKWYPSVLLDIFAIPNPHILFALATEAQRVVAR